MHLLIFRFPEPKGLASYFFLAVAAVSITIRCLKRVFTRSRRAPASDSLVSTSIDQRPPALHVLLLLFCPSQGSLWPDSYSRLAAQADASQTGLLAIPLQMLFDDIAAGLVELRYPEVINRSKRSLECL